METHRSYGYEIHTLDKMIGRTVASLCEKDGLTQMQSWLIGYLYDHSSEDVFQKDIEAQFHITPSTVSGILKIMEKRGFLLRQPVPNDARLKRLVLTEKGVGHKLNIMRNIDHLEQLLRKDIPEEQLDTFINVIHHMKQNIQKDIP